MTDTNVKAKDLPWYTEPQLHAQPYDLCAKGFYFSSVEEYQQKASANLNDYGDPVEEYELQFIDGDDLDCDLFKALGVNQANFQHYFKACEDWDDDQRRSTSPDGGVIYYRSAAAF